MGRKNRPEGRPPGVELAVVQKILGIVPIDSLSADLQDAVFVCIDCEAYEHTHEKITEVGVAVLDPRDVRGLSPKDSSIWLQRIHAAHYRPIEYAKLRNKTHVKGDPDSFNFGPSTWICLQDGKRLLKRIMLNPAELRRAAKFDLRDVDASRNVILVGHGLSNDIHFLRTLGFTTSDSPNIIRTVDTQKLSGSKKKSVGLARLLPALGLNPNHLHNAGNDAVYTLHALILMALREATSPGSLETALALLPHKPVHPKDVSEVIAPQIYGGTAKDANPFTTLYFEFVKRPSAIPNRLTSDIEKTNVVDDT